MSPFKDPIKRREYMRKWREDHREQCRSYQVKYKNNHEEKLKERNHKYYQFVKMKKNPLTKIRNYAEKYTPVGKQCEICETKENLERHHPNYNQRLLVKTLCKSCHKLIHITKPKL